MCAALLAVACGCVPIVLHDVSVPTACFVCVTCSWCCKIGEFHCSSSCVCACAQMQCRASSRYGTGGLASPVPHSSRQYRPSGCHCYHNVQQRYESCPQLHVRLMVCAPVCRLAAVRRLPQLCIAPSLLPTARARRTKYLLMCLNVSPCCSTQTYVLGFSHCVSCCCCTVRAFAGLHSELCD